MDLFTNNQYILYNKDNEILSFHSERNEKNEPIFVVDKTYTDKRPFGFSNLTKWIENRRAPKHREHIRELLTKCGCNDLEGYIRFTYCAGLNDTFWVRPIEQSLCWEDVSLYQNEFDETIARIAFDGGLMGEAFSSATPELATDGTFPKCWKRYENGIFLLKQGSSGAKNAGREPFSEAYAYELASQICDNPVPYEVIKHHGKLAAKCPLFTSEQISYAPIAYILHEKVAFDEVLAFYESIGAGDKFRQMMVLDALTMNTDRHLKNFGILYNADTIEILDMAPVFDNNLSLCPYAEPEDLENLNTYLKTRHSAFDEDFNEIAYRCLTKDIKNRLISLKGFTFDRRHKYHLPEERLRLLENMIEAQIDNILQNRKIRQSVTTEVGMEPVSLDNFLITLDASRLDSFIKQILTKEKFKINDFVIITKSGKRLEVKNCQYAVMEYDTVFEIEIYNADIIGRTESLAADRIEALSLTAKADIEECLYPETLEVQLGKNEETQITVFEQQTIQLTGEQSGSDYDLEKG